MLVNFSTFVNTIQVLVELIPNLNFQDVIPTDFDVSGGTYRRSIGWTCNVIDRVILRRNVASWKFIVLACDVDRDYDEDIGLADKHTIYSSL